MFFKKKIIVTEEMKQTLQSFDEISSLLMKFLELLVVAFTLINSVMIALR